MKNLKTLLKKTTVILLLLAVLGTTTTTYTDYTGSQTADNGIMPCGDEADHIWIH